MEIVKDCEVWWLNLELLPRNPHDGKEGNEEIENFSLKLSMFFTVSSVSCFCTNFSFHLPATSLPEASLLIDEL